MYTIQNNETGNIQTTVENTPKPTDYITEFWAAHLK